MTEITSVNAGNLFEASSTKKLTLVSECIDVQFEAGDDAGWTNEAGGRGRVVSTNRISPSKSAGIEIPSGMIRRLKRVGGCGDAHVGFIRIPGDSSMFCSSIS